ncbi:hypothetical protein IscW_ISCW017982 [Ixodes scapularis]|uniref:Uncharacterized protein n=1 Tax=Ixodes scapularis TaxID=6945 RepID=B7PIC6_IXOSC|nr:hypothetical protein IscW_ISCW017982 [Ixodes scapularis]|eukprot:XP_002404807.1 hypothetical protein IscW_ISCW017982 [Ixodes scapularis]
MFVYTDYVALWGKAMSHRRRTIVRKLQQILDNVVHRLCQPGLTVSPEKKQTLYWAPRFGTYQYTLKILGKVVLRDGRATYPGVQPEG